MGMSASVLSPPLRTYRGTITDPDRWNTWTPGHGDIIVCTPPKCGTTWTQTMAAMLLQGGPELPEPVPVMSPWVDADLGVPSSEVADALARQAGRKVVKTHTPADGFPVWEGVVVIAVYRHPLDVFFSLRKHNANVSEVAEDEPMCWPLSRSFRYFVDAEADLHDYDRDKLSTITMHYNATVLSGRVPDLRLLHYADLVRDGRRAVGTVAKAAGIDAGPDLVERVAEGSSFNSMKARAADYVPVGGTGFWKSDANFFDSASSGKWQGVLSDEDLLAYKARLEELVPDAGARAWLEHGDTAGSPVRSQL